MFSRTSSSQNCPEKGATGFNPSYTGGRPEVLDLVPRGAERVLDVGCSDGTFGSRLRSCRGAREVVGIEMDSGMSHVARRRLDQVLHGDAETLDLNDHFPTEHFHVIVLADVLEHFRDPWSFLQRTMPFLHPEGELIISIPNVRHLDTLCQLVFKGRWPYRERGLHDHGHLRFFALRNLVEMVQGCGCEILDLKRVYRLIERPHRLNIFAPVCGILPFREFFTFQYLVRARRRPLRIHGGRLEEAP